MNIPENFDRWMFDYKEGNLSGAELREFENFLIQHPEFEAEADAWDNAYVKNEDFVYHGAKQLEKHAWYTDAYKVAAALLLLLLVGGSTILVFHGGSKEGNLADGSGSGNGTTVQNSSAAGGPVSDENSNLTNSANVNAYHGVAANLNAQFNRFSHTPAVNGNNGNVAVNVGVIQANNNQYANNNFSIAGNNGGSKSGNNSMNDESLNEEQGKFSSDKNSGKYQNNPTNKSLNFDVSKKGSVNYNSFRNRVKRVYRKIERIMGYQPGLTNLGNPDIMLPQSSILGMNPGFAGGSLSPRFEMNYRNQWWGSNMNSQSLNMSFDNYSQSLRGGYGVMISAQDFGMGGYTDVNMSAFYSPKIVLGKHFTLEPAVKVTLGAMSVNAEKMSSISQLEINRGHSINMSGAAMANGVGRLWYKDYGLGLMLNSKWFFAGFSADNLAGHYENVYTGDGFEPSRMPTRISAILGTDIEREHKKNFTLSPFVAYEKFDQRNEIWAGFNYRLKWVTVGGSISNNLDFTASAGVKFEKFRLIYRYDRTQSQLLSSPAASHNIGIRINGDVIRKGSLRK